MTITIASDCVILRCMIFYYIAARHVTLHECSTAKDCHLLVPWRKFWRTGPPNWAAKLVPWQIHWLQFNGPSWNWLLFHRKLTSFSQLEVRYSQLRQAEPKKPQEFGS